MSQFTKKAIKDSMIRLLNDRPLNKITVKDIVEDCGINRNTFYYYYQDIYALLEDIFETEARAVIEVHKDYQSWQDGLIQSTAFALQNKRAIYHIYNSINRDQLERYLYSVSEDLMNWFVARQSEGLQVTEEDQHLVALFYKHAVVGILMEWIQQGMKEDPEQTIRQMGQLFDGNIRHVLTRAAEKSALSTNDIPAGGR
jgi:probable dihydroxyacetone kinase regulator